MRWPLVEVRWLDSCGPDGWQKLSDQLRYSLSGIVTVGYLVYEDARKKVIAPHIDIGFGLDDPSVHGLLHIPTVAIYDYRVLREASVAESVDAVGLKPTPNGPSDAGSSPAARTNP